MSFTLIVWLSALSFGLQTIIGKLTSKYSIQNPWLLTFFLSVFNLLLTAAIAVNFDISWPANYLPYISAGFFLAVGTVLLTYSIFKLDVTVISPLFALRTAFTAILSFVFLQEKFSGFEYLLILIIFICGMLVKLDENFSLKKITSDIWMGVLCMLFLSLSNITIKYASVGGNYWQNTLWINIFSMLFLLFTLPKFYSDLRKTPVNKYLGALGYAITGGIGRLLSFFAIAINATVTTAITSLPTSMLITIPLAYIFPKLLEKHTTKVYVIRLVLAAIMVGCSIKLSLR